MSFCKLCIACITNFKTAIDREYARQLEREQRKLKRQTKRANTSCVIQEPVSCEVHRRCIEDVQPTQDEFVLQLRENYVFVDASSSP